MEIVIDIDSPAPLFGQLIEQIKAAVSRDVLRPGDALPSIRQLATDLEINAKTVAKAYRLLERDSVLETKGYRGTFVHPDAKANCAVDLPARVLDELSRAVDAARAIGATDSEIRIAFGEAMQRPAPPYGARRGD